MVIRLKLTIMSLWQIFQTMKMLVIYTGNKLNFNYHIAILCTKVGLNILQRMRRSLYYVSRIAIYNNFIISNFNYCPVACMSTSKFSLNKRENIQNRALRFVCNDFVINYSELGETHNFTCTIWLWKFINVWKIWIHNTWMKCLHWRNIPMI